MLRFWKKLLPVSLALIAVLTLAAVGNAPAQDHVLQNTVNRKDLNDGGDVDDVIFGPLTASVTADTSNWIAPWKWTGILLKVSGNLNSKAIQAQAWCGRKYSDSLSLTAKCDSLDITTTGVKIWQLNVPTTSHMHIIFSSASTVTSAQIDSVTVFRNW
jgi:hypothetical protein